MARPRKEVSARQVERAASIGCTNEEIATLCACSADTLTRRFADSLKRGRDRGKRSLRRMQWKAAKSGNVTMMIWLGKQLIGQADKVEHSGPEGGPVTTKHTFDYGQFARELGDMRRERNAASGSGGPADRN